MNDQDQTFDFAQWKINLDIKNQLAIARSPYEDLLIEAMEKYPILKGFFVDVLFDGIYVLINHDRLQSFDPFIYDGCPIPFTFHAMGKNGWSLGWKNDILLYDGIEYFSGNFSSVQNWKEDKSMRDNLIDNIEKTKESLRQVEENLRNEKSISASEKEWNEDRVETFTNSIRKMNLFLDESNKKISYLEYGRFTKIIEDV